MLDQTDKHWRGLRDMQRGYTFPTERGRSDRISALKGYEQAAPHGLWPSRQTKIVPKDPKAPSLQCTALKRQWGQDFE